MLQQTKLQNTTIQTYDFLKGMYQDAYYPNNLVDACKAVLLELCQQIETTDPANLAELYILSHAATNEINLLEDAFYKQDSEIETIARECLAEDFYAVAQAYGFDADMEELIATREW